MKKLIVPLVLFVGINLFLIVKEDSSVQPLNYLSSWKQVATGSLETLLPTKGVVVPAREYSVFLQDSTEFKEFLVAEGDRVQVGTPLFQYDGGELEAQVELLESELSRLEGEKRNRERLLRELKKMRTDAQKTVKVPSDDDDPEVRLALLQEATSRRELVFALDGEIAQAELELENVEEEIEMYEKQRDAVEKGTAGLTVVSPYAGIVEKVNMELGNPVITISTEDVVVEGELSEADVRFVAEGMPVRIRARALEEAFVSEVTSVAERPREKPALHQDSFYRFDVELNAEELLIGEHVDLEIITESVEDVPIVTDGEFIQDGDDAFVWGLTGNGRLIKKDVTLGLQVADEYEVVVGIAPGEYYVDDASAVKRDGPYITPFQWDKGIVEKWKSTSFKEIGRYILVGVLQR